MNKTRKYPRYFVLTDEELVEENKVWMAYAMVKVKNGYVYYLHKRNGKFGDGGKDFRTFRGNKESFADSCVRIKKWREVKAQELVLLI